MPPVVSGRSSLFSPPLTGEADMRRFGILFGLTVLGLCAIALADKITLKDGTVLDGVAIKQGDKYWIKTTDGNTRLIPQTDVKSITKGDGAPPVTPAGTPGS